jgi:amphi-Trp domain-containing protein
LCFRPTGLSYVAPPAYHPAMPSKRARDIEKVYPRRQFIAKLRRLADALESGKPFTIQVANERIAIPADAMINIEHEREGRDEELEFQVKWKRG